MDENSFAKLQARLPEWHLSRRLERQVEHVAMRFDVRRFNFMHFYWENFDMMPKILRLMLAMTGTLGMARRAAINFSVRQHTIDLPSLPPAFHNYRILHLSDLHIDEMMDAGKHLREIVQQQNYDLCVLTGDYRFDTTGRYDRSIDAMRALVEAIDCPDGVIGILGNHDFIEMVPELEAMGVRMLLNEPHLIEKDGQRLWIAGVDDCHYYQVDDLSAATRMIPDEETTILLVHSPEIIEQAQAANVDFYLCGHTHGGQVCLPGGRPMITNARCDKEYVSGRWRAGHMEGYTSLGTGASGLAVRINCPPDVSIHRLINPPRRSDVIGQNAGVDPARSP